MVQSTGRAVRDCLPAVAAEYRRPLPLPSRPALDRHLCCTPLATLCVPPAAAVAVRVMPAVLGS